MAIVALDLGRSFGPDSLARLQREARKNSNVSLVLAAASHTHAGPMISDHYEGDTPPDWEFQAISRIAQAIHEASTRLVNVQVGAGYGVTYNRLITDWRPRGRRDSKFDSRTNRMISSPIDPTVAVLRVDTTDGKPLAILVNYACHPVVFSAQNTSYSADFPAAMVKTIEAAFGGAPMAFFLQGGPGDIDPYYGNTPTQQDPDRWRNWTGEKVGDEAVRVAKSIQTKAEEGASLDFVDQVIDFRLRWDPQKFYDTFARTWGPEDAKRYYPKVGPIVPAPVSHDFDQQTDCIHVPARRAIC